MSESKPKAAVSTKDTLNKAEDLSGGHISHADHIRLSFADNETTFDFYRVESEDAEPKAQRLHRIALPVETVREMAQHLLEADAKAEKLPD